MSIGNLLFDNIWQVRTIDNKIETVSSIDIVSEEGENYKDIIMPFANLKVVTLVFFISVVEVIYEFRKDTDIRRFREKKHSKQEIIDKINARGIANWFDYEKFLQYPEGYIKDEKEVKNILKLSLNIADDSNEAHFGGAYVNVKNFCPKCALMILLQQCINGLSPNGYADNVTSSLGTITLLEGGNLLSTIKLNLFDTQKTIGQPIWLTGTSNEYSVFFDGKKQKNAIINEKYKHLSDKEKKNSKEYNEEITEANKKNIFNLSSEKITFADLLFFNLNKTKIVFEQKDCCCDFCGEKTNISTSHYYMKAIPIKHSFFNYPFSPSNEITEEKKKELVVSHNYPKFDNKFIWKNFFQYILGKNFENVSILNKKSKKTTKLKLSRNVSQNINNKKEIEGFILFMPSYDDRKGKVQDLFTSEEFFSFKNYTDKIENEFCEIIQHCYQYFEILSNSSFKIANIVNSENKTLKKELLQTTKTKFNDATEIYMLKLMKEIDDDFIDNYKEKFIIKIKNITIELFDKCFLQYKDKNVKEYFKAKNFFKMNVLKHFNSYI